MHLKKVTLPILFLLLEQGKSHILDSNVAQSDCEIICEASGGQPEFDTETKLCKCLLTKNIVDDTDVALIRKNAELIGKNPNRLIIKRDASPEPKTTTTTETTVLHEAATTPLDSEESELPFEDVVGQHAPARRPHQRVVAPRRQRPITPEQQRLIVQQIHDHLARLTQISDQRLREIEMEAIRTNLRQLSQTHLIQTPQQRPRMRNIDDRRRSQRPRLRLVGAANPDFKENSTESGADATVKDIFHGKKHRFEIITQDPSLIDE